MLLLLLRLLRHLSLHGAPQHLCVCRADEAAAAAAAAGAAPLVFEAGAVLGFGRRLALAEIVHQTFSQRGRLGIVWYVYVRLQVAAARLWPHNDRPPSSSPPAYGLLVQ